MSSIHSFKCTNFCVCGYFFSYEFLTIYELYCTQQGMNSLLVPQSLLQSCYNFCLSLVHVACNRLVLDPAGTGSIRHKGSFQKTLTESHACGCEMSTHTHTHLSTKVGQVITYSGIFPLQQGFFLKITGLSLKVNKKWENRAEIFLGLGGFFWVFFVRSTPSKWARTS